MILMNNFKIQWAELAPDCLASMERVGSSGWYVLGREVRDFEEGLAAMSGASHAVGCGNGLDAIEIALRSLGLQPGGKVLTTPLSAFATTLAIVRAGGVPVYVDVDETGLLDLDLVEEALKADPDIRYLVPVHLFGHPMDLIRLKRIKERYGIALVEDAAQAIGASHGDLPIGSAGDATTLSFYPTKNLGAIGDAGALLTHSDALAARFRSLRDYGQSSKYVHSDIGMNSRLDELHAAVLRTAMLPRLSQWIERRRGIASLYRNHISHGSVEFVPVNPAARSVWHLFPVLVPSRLRDNFMAHLSGLGVQSGIHYPRLIPDQDAMKGVAGMTFMSMLDRARSFAESEVSLPIHPYLGESEVERVIEAVNSWRPS